MKNTLWTGDNIYILNGMNSASVDLIYLDPPFNSKRSYSAPVGSEAAGSSFKDMWTWNDVDEELLDGLFLSHPELADYIESISVTHSKPMMAYIAYMAQRIIQMHRTLKPTGSLYLHCDQTASHYIKILLDVVFGQKNLLGDISWNKKNGVKTRTSWGNENDNILVYAKQKGKHVFNTDDEDLRTSFSETSLAMHFNKKDDDGRLYRERTVNKKKYIYYADEGRFIGNVWNDIPSMQANSPLMKKERTGYPTQKPLALLRRIIKASSNPGDVVFDPFCGCATTCVAAQQLKRKWIGIDIEEQAVNVLLNRLHGDAGMFRDFVHRTDVPRRTDIKHDDPENKTIKERLFRKQNRTCNACDFTADEMRHFHIDHIIPKSKGGGDYYENFQLLCGSCNSIKGDRPMEYLRARIRKIREAKTKISFGE